MGFNGLTTMCLDVYGQGQHGNLTVAAGTTAVLSADMYYKTLVVNGSLLTANYSLHCLSLSGTGIIDNSGQASTDTRGATAAFSTGTWPAPAGGQDGIITGA